jgi:hypothetical protein
MRERERRLPPQLASTAHFQGRKKETRRQSYGSAALPTPVKNVMAKPVRTRGGPGGHNIVSPHPPTPETPGPPPPTRTPPQKEKTPPAAAPAKSRGKGRLGPREETPPPPPGESTRGRGGKTPARAQPPPARPAKTHHFSVPCFEPHAATPTHFSFSAPWPKY